MMVRPDGPADRAFLVGALTSIAGPVLENASRGQLKAEMPVREWEKNRFDTAALEAVSRTLAGVAPWVELGDDGTSEGKLRGRYGEMARQALVNTTTPDSPDAMDFGVTAQAGAQALVEAAFLAHALLRAPGVLWEPLTGAQKAKVVAALKSTRELEPHDTNWRLFPAIVEAALWTFTGEMSDERLTLGVKKHQEWYKGDGIYGDGAAFRWDYYNSYVIHPMLLGVLAVCREKGHPLGGFHDEQLKRARRYAVILERMISPEGTFPVMGRSSTYRFAAFHALSDVILRKQLPGVIDPGGVRAGINAVVRRMVGSPGTFDVNGWLDAGAVGFQPSMRDHYNNTGALYLCLTGLLHLGLPPDAPFWTAPPGDWTQKKIWSGQDVPRDHPIAQ